LKKIKEATAEEIMEAGMPKGVAEGIVRKLQE
jgi:excinuclease ABC subunit C